MRMVVDLDDDDNHDNNNTVHHHHPKTTTTTHRQIEFAKGIDITVVMIVAMMMRRRMTVPSDDDRLGERRSTMLSSLSSFDRTWSFGRMMVLGDDNAMTVVVVVFVLR